MSNKKTPEEDRREYRKSCSHYRRGHVVYSKNGHVVFTGKQYMRAPDGLSREMPCINAAKRFVKEQKIRSYTVQS